MELERLAESIYTVFVENQYKWRIDGLLKLPRIQDIVDTLVIVDEYVKSMPDGSRFEVGRLIFQKIGDKIDVYVLHGTMEIKEEE
ncbi:hypothetical protein HUN41_00257 [Streptomyces phage Coruscant]|uniref:Uncharacterized protein n=1 Tax=Streptomyces phage Coruscant TaxID=2739834 RepID=A0A7G4AWF5_9CAUD|nr:hypothetical protein PP454_gp072 [Streptomyces phage Coruscant]QMP84345.1 hypothetical protein HUN41_00257 [Streptomyces phage Coruscant]